MIPANKVFAAERKNPRKFSKYMNTRDLMNFLIERRSDDLPASALAKVLDRLIWCFDDNGHELLKERELWLSSNDKYKTEVALLMDEVFPYETNHEMEDKLHQISIKWPEFSERCINLITQRKQMSL